MAKKKVEEIVTELVAPIAEKHSYELVDVEFVKEGANWYLRVYIDKPEGIGIDDCQAVSEELSDRLDETDPIVQSYFLEVSSPGLERPLKKPSDFEKYRGELVEVSLYSPLNGKKTYEGVLLGLKDGRICISQEKAGDLEFDIKEVSIVKRVIKF